MKWSRYLIRYQRKCKSHVAVIGNFGYLQKISCLVLKCGERERWDEHEPIIHIWWYISPPHLNVGSGFVWFQIFQVKSCQTSSAFCLFFFVLVLVLVLSFGAWGMQFLVLFYSCSGSSVTLSHLVEIWKGINHKTKDVRRARRQ